MKLAITATLGVIALFSVSGPASPFSQATRTVLSGPASAQDMNDYRWHNLRGQYPWNPGWDPRGYNCRIVDVRTTNRFGTEVTIHQRVCG